MHDRPSALLVEDPRQQPCVLDVALVERHAFGDREAKAGDEVVDYRYRPSGVEQCQHRMAADVTGASGDQDRDLLRHRPPVSTKRARRETVIAARAASP